MTREALENAITFMIRTYLQSELIVETDVDDILANVKGRVVRGI